MNSRDPYINGFELLCLLKRGYKAIIVFLILGLMAAGLGVLLTQKKYEAVGVIQIGRYGEIGHLGGVGFFSLGSQQLESSNQTIERIRSRQFQQAVAEKLGDQEWINDIEKSLVSKNISVILLKNSGVSGEVSLVELRVRGSSPEGVNNKLNSIALRLMDVHDGFMENAVGYLKINLVWARDALSEAEKSLFELSKIQQKMHTQNNGRILEIVPFLVAEKEARILDFRQRIAVLERALEAPITVPTKMIERIYSSADPVYPNPTFMLLIGLGLGLIFGILWVLVRDRWQQLRIHH